MASSESSAAGRNGNAKRLDMGEGTDEERDGEKCEDLLVYPGLYAPSGFDIMSILIRVATRPSPKINLGNIDCSCALVLCDTFLPGTPIVYCSDAFLYLTGYESDEVLGRNCRFLQMNPQLVSARRSMEGGIIWQGAGKEEGRKEGREEWERIDREKTRELREKIEKKEEAQVEIINFKKGGEMFLNLLTVIPVSWDRDEEMQGNSERRGKERYIIGFQVDLKTRF